MQILSLGPEVPWRKTWQPTPVFLPGESHGQGSLASYIQPIVSQRVGHDWSDLPCTQGQNGKPLSVQFSCSVVPSSLQFHTRLPCLSPTPGAYLNSCPSCPWCHPTISSSVIPFSSFLQSFPTSGSFPKSQFFTSGGQSVRVSASASVLPMRIQDWSLLVLTGWISLQSKGLLSIFSNTTGQKHLFLDAQLSL